MDKRRSINKGVLAATIASYAFLMTLSTHAAKDNKDEVEVNYQPPMAEGYRITQCPGSLAGQEGCPGNFSHSATSQATGWGTADAWDVVGSGKVEAVADGEVVEVGYKAGPMNYGNYVRIKHDDGTYSFYAHLASVDVREGKRVDGGDSVGVMGNTGSPWCSPGGKPCYTGAHLHFSLYDADGRPMSCSDRIDMFEQEGLVAKGERKVKEGISIVGKQFGINVQFEMEGLDYGFEWDEDIGAPVPKAVHVQNIQIQEFRGIIAGFYTWSLGVGAMVAFLVILYGGILYILSAGNPAKRTNAKEWITSAITGLLLLFTAYLILHTVDPCLVGSC